MTSNIKTNDDQVELTRSGVLYKTKRFTKFIIKAIFVSLAMLTVFYLFGATLLEHVDFIGEIKVWIENNKTPLIISRLAMYGAITWWLPSMMFFENYDSEEINQLKEKTKMNFRLILAAMFLFGELFFYLSNVL